MGLRITLCITVLTLETIVLFAKNVSSKLKRKRFQYKKRQQSALNTNKIGSFELCVGANFTFMLVYEKFTGNLICSKKTTGRATNCAARVRFVYQENDY